MALLAVVSQKGGVGKTTVALNLSYALARRGWKTLVMDVDPLGAVGLSVQGANRRGQGLLAHLEGRIGLQEAILQTHLPELAVLPVAGAAGLPSDPEQDQLLADRDKMGRVFDSLRPLYDLVVVDTPSGLQGPAAVALELADHALVPLQAEPLALRSITQLLNRLGQLRERGARVEVVGFVVSMLNSRSDVSLTVAQESWSTLPPELVLNGFVPRDPAFLKASAYGVPIGLLSRRPPPVAAVFDQIAAELEPRLGLLREESADEPISLLD